MTRVLTAALALHWMAAFAMTTAHAVGAAAGFRSDGRFASLAPSSNWEVIGQAGIATGSALVAALFFWILVSALADQAAVVGIPELVRLAFSAAIAVTTLSLIAGLPGIYDTHAASSAMPLIALLFSYLVMRGERNSPERAAIAVPDIKAPARLMALAAAHSSLLPRLGKTLVPANDRGKR
ncbi:MAG TPA: hypothetical protein VFT89_09320 [Rhizobiaceae bacterium]|nr:hypothetical protein [Rhizobiaceae bacterium]